MPMNTVQADVDAIHALYDQYCLGANTGDLDLFMSVWSDDAIRMGQDIPAVVGKEAVRGFFQPMFEGLDTHITLHGDTEVGVSGDMAYGWGNATLSMTPKGGGPTTTVDAKWLDVLKKGPDGSWKIYRDSVTNNGLPATE
jgi:uncharacterized protein (TIGR02246 family)